MDLLYAQKLNSMVCPWHTMSTRMNNSHQQQKFMIKGSLVQQGRSENRHKDLLVMLGAEMRTQIEKCY